MSYIIGKASLCICAYFCSAGDKTCEEKYTACSVPSSDCKDRTVPNPYFQASILTLCLAHIESTLNDLYPLAEEAT